ncbi:hypothetical protein DFS34DRAFT_602171 [Phlyctochytrium arcticum]|nr:hypothetical protein DFS34DRAFT_602171 [Phlyctochytrium arcticum]
MGKVGKERKKRKLQQQDVGQFRPDTPSTGGNGSEEWNEADEDLDVADLIGGVVRPSDLATTIATLTQLEEQAEILRGKAFKGLRIALHRLNQATQLAGVGNGTSLSGRISDALTDGRWNDALSALAEMRERGQTPKLGALQRWVRDCDAVGSEEGLDGDPQVLRVLDAILRTADPSMVPPATGQENRAIRRHPPWAGREKGTEEEDPLPERDYKDDFRVVSHEKGAERWTPNLHDFILYTSKPGTIPPTEPEFPAVKRIDVPGVPGCFFLQDVLSRTQCRQMMAAAESIGFTPDEPIAGAASESDSVLAHNFFWLADSDLIKMIVSRCEPHLPAEMAGGKLAGLNPRWRMYRYVPGALYRPHCDGAWPESALDPVTGQYVYDYRKDRRSKLTFLVYLNEDFEGGSTTFFTPSATVGVMDAQPVSPRQGCVLCFPHGDTKGTLLHEGSAVTRGAKYIIRADVLYTISDSAAE